MGFNKYTESKSCALHNTFEGLHTDFIDIVKNKKLLNIDFYQIGKFWFLKHIYDKLVVYNYLF